MLDCILEGVYNRVATKSGKSGKSQGINVLLKKSKSKKWSGNLAKSYRKVREKA